MDLDNWMRGAFAQLVKMRRAVQNYTPTEE